MKIFLLLFLLFISLLYAQNDKNDLQYETSPYLKQHENNPVHWHAWNTKTLLKAQKEHKAIFLSIGYSTCHWCHVMAKESFENKKIAKLLNKYFIAIKVDREEMPQIDALYQNIFYHVHKRTGGWPLSVFMTPQREVFSITGYIPPQKESYSEGFSKLIQELARLYNNKKVLQKKIRKIQTAVKTNVKLFFTQNKNISLDTLKKSIQKSFDDICIGFGTGRKFPEAAKLSLMMDLAVLTKNKKLQKNSFEMLDVMALRGLYDQIGGGFFRYSIDVNWEIPHFEKMLYNQAELIPLYVRAYTLKSKKLYKNIVQETIAMVDKRFLKHNLYWSASNADSEGKEGAFFIFTTKEIQQALKNNPYAAEIRDALGFSIEGNFKNKVHINFETQTRPPCFALFRKNLYQLKAKKTYPFIDKKINTAWNAMMIEALYKASAIDKKYAKTADKNLAALEKLMLRKGELYHQTIFGVKPKQKGLLEDYSFFISALIAGYEVDYDAKKLDFAEYLLNLAKSKFCKKGVWYLSDDALHVKAGLNDKYYTSPLSKMLQNIIKLAALKASFSYEKLAHKSINSLKQELIQKQADVPALAQAYLMQDLGVVVLKSSKENLLKNAKIMQKIKYPYVLSEAKEYNDFLACTLRRCFAKSKNLNSVIQIIDTNFIRK
ncbi:thioredoxin domain-containing protein [Sulfurimonas sp.]